MLHNKIRHSQQLSREIVVRQQEVSADWSKTFFATIYRYQSTI